MRLFAVLLWLGIPTAAFAQLTITGAVTDERGEPLPGASIGVVGTTIGTTAAADGQFALVLPLPEAETLLEARFVGYQSTQRTIRQNDGSTTVVFQLAWMPCNWMKSSSPAFPRPPAENNWAMPSPLSAPGSWQRPAPRPSTKL